MNEQEELRQQAEARVGTTLSDKWRLDKLLGVGGMASVYAATHTNQKRVAVKILHPSLSSHPEVRARFLREGYLANTVGHSGVVTVDDDNVLEDGSAFLVMELLQGETLEARRHGRGGTLPVDEVLAYAEPLLDVLVAAHDKGVVHRDLKPDNLFLTTGGELKVLDFGIARLQEMSASSGGTRIGAIMGTPTFMAPEQARARWDEVDGRTDLFAVGASMYTLLSGRYVHEAETINEELGLAMTARAASLAVAAPGLPAPVVAFVDRALAFEKAARWPDARAMRAALSDVRAVVRGGRTAPASLLGAAPEPDSPDEGPVSAAPAPRRFPRAPILAGAAAVVAVVGILALRPGSHPAAGVAPSEGASLPTPTASPTPVVIAGTGVPGAPASIEVSPAGSAAPSAGTTAPTVNARALTALGPKPDDSTAPRNVPRSTTAATPKAPTAPRAPAAPTTNPFDRRH
jgi:tRNA A-37 threonylcarbamoyl transferase component Bud32